MELFSKNILFRHKAEAGRRKISAIASIDAKHQHMTLLVGLDVKALD
jgi:hypothetical protein